MFRSLRSVSIVCSIVIVFTLAGCGGNQNTTRSQDKQTSVDPALKQAVQSIQQADQDIQAEKVKNNQRVGVALAEPSPIHRGNSVVSSATDATHQLRIVLRQQRSKKDLPGASVEARFLDEAGQQISQVSLSETWGPYLFHGQNVSIPSDADKLSVLVEPSASGRHGGMKEISKNTFTVSFDLSSQSNGWRVEGPEPTSVASDYTLGKDVRIALEESLEMKTNSPYKIGLIAEHSEPFWIPHDHAGTAHMHMAEIPEDANRHMEIVLLDEATNRIVPRADITMRLAPDGDDDAIETQLPFLLATFNHYGNSLKVPHGSYEITATIERPQLSHLEDNQFPETVTETFQWTNEESSEEDEEHHS